MPSLRNQNEFLAATTDAHGLCPGLVGFFFGKAQTGLVKFKVKSHVLHSSFQTNPAWASVASRTLTALPSATRRKLWPTLQLCRSRKNRLQTSCAFCFPFFAFYIQRGSIMRLEHRIAVFETVAAVCTFSPVIHLGRIRFTIQKW